MNLLLALLACALAPANPDASVRLKVGDTIYAAALPAAPSTDTWLDGPLVTERRYRVTPADPAGKPHPLLRVIFDVRTYRDGAARLDVAVENVLNKPGAGTVAYAVDILSGDRVLFHRDVVSHRWLTRWRKVFPLNGLAEAAVVHDFRPFEQAGAIPHYLPDVAPQDYSVTGPTFDILGAGYINPNMGSPGASSDIGPLPDWTGRYLAQQRPEQRAVTLANGDLAGSFAFHLREPEGGTYPGLGADRLISIVQRPDFWSDYRGHAGQILEGLADGALGIKTSHVGSYSYVPYLVTGDRYYADEMKFMANFELLNDWGSQDYPRGAQGLVINPGTMGRQAAWVLRDLADAAAYVPDADPSKAYFVDVVAANLKWLDWYAKNGVITFGVAWLSGGATKTPDGVEHDVVQPWMHNYLAYALDHANLQGFDAGKALRDQIVGFQLRLFTSPEYPREYAAPGFISRSDRHLDPSGNWVHEFYTTLGQAFRGSFPPGTGPTPFVGYYGNDAALVLQLAIRDGRPGAREAYDWLMVQPGMLDYLRNRAGWHVQLVPGLEAPDLLAGAVVVDDGDPGFAKTAGWMAAPGGQGNDYLYASPGDGSARATWTFDVTPGRPVEVWATWYATDNRATNAPYAIRDGGAEVATARVNQQKVPDTYTPRAGNWQKLATVTPKAGKIEVTLSNQADQYAIADAVAVKGVAATK